MQKSEYFRDLNRRVVGCGPYRLVEWLDGQRITLERWEGYYGSKPAIERIVFKIVKDPNQALNLFLRGELHEMDLTPMQYSTMAATPAFTKIGVTRKAPQWSYYFVYWNVRPENPFFSDRRVRQAAAHAVDIPRLVESVSFGLYEQCRGIYHPQSWMSNPDMQVFPHDVSAASKLLDAAGWKEDESEGWRYKTIDGQRTKFRVSLLVPAASVMGKRIAIAVQSDLRKVGIEVDVQTIEFGAMVQRRNDGQFDGCVYGLGTGVDPDRGQSTWRTGGPRNYNGYSNLEVDRLFDLGRQELDQKKRAVHYQRQQKLIYEDQPCLFVCYLATLHAFNKRLQGIELSPRGAFNTRPSMRAWSILPEEETAQTEEETAQTKEP